MDKNKCSLSFIPTGYITGCVFDLLTDKEIEEKSVVEISSSANTTQDKTPHSYGPRSQFLGTDSSKYKCLTCNQSKEHCRVGHVGYIKTFPLFSPHKLIMGITRKVISILCHNPSCNKLIFSTDKLNFEQKEARKKKKKPAR